MKWGQRRSRATAKTDGWSAYTGAPGVSCPAIYSGRGSDNWHLDGDTISVNMMRWKRRGGRNVIIAPDGGDAWAPAKPRPDETLIRALARAHR